LIVVIVVFFCSTVLVAVEVVVAVKLLPGGRERVLLFSSVSAER